MFDDGTLPRPSHGSTVAPARGTRQDDKRPCAPLNRNARDTLIGGPSLSGKHGSRLRAALIDPPAVYNDQLRF